MKNTSITRAQREELVQRNIGLVHSCAHKLKGRGIEYDDIFQAGCIGLLKAVDGFDETRGAAFSTYAVPVVLGEMRRLFRDGGSVKISRSLKELSLKAAREREKFLLEHLREPTVGELAALLGVEPAQMAEALAAASPVLSLTACSDENEQIDVPVIFNDEELLGSITLTEMINLLEEKDRKIVYLRYFKERTQTQTAEILGMTQVQISRREKKILLTLRQKLTG